MRPSRSDVMASSPSPRTDNLLSRSDRWCLRRFHAHRIPRGPRSWLSECVRTDDEKAAAARARTMPCANGSRQAGTLWLGCAAIIASGARNAMSIARPYLMFLGDAADQLAAKTAQGIVRLAAGLVRRPVPARRLQGRPELPDMTVEQAAAAGVKTVIVGVANRGGVIGETGSRCSSARSSWGSTSPAACISASSDVPALAEAAKKHGRQLLRRPPPHPRFRRRHRQASAGQAHAHRRHRLLDRQDVHGPRAREGDAGARPQGRFPRHRPDRHLHRRRRRLHRRGGLRLHLRRRRVAHARRTSPTTGTWSRARARCSTPPMPASPSA